MTDFNDINMNSAFNIHVEEFMTYLKVEKGSSIHTIRAYSSDLRKLIRFLVTSGLTSFSQVDRKVFSNFTSTLYDNKLCDNSVRRTIETCKKFFWFLKR
jgi:site-specific recombinase XerD